MGLLFLFIIYPRIIYNSITADSNESLYPHKKSDCQMQSLVRADYRLSNIL